MTLFTVLCLLHHIPTVCRIAFTFLKPLSNDIPAKTHGVFDAPVDSPLLDGSLLTAPGLKVLTAIRAHSLVIGKLLSNSYKIFLKNY
jgi:hypothetical protein